MRLFYIVCSVLFMIYVYYLFFELSLMDLIFYFKILFQVVLNIQIKIFVFFLMFKRYYYCVMNFEIINFKFMVGQSKSVLFLRGKERGSRFDGWSFIYKGDVQYYFRFKDLFSLIRET